MRKTISRGKTGGYERKFTKKTTNSLPIQKKGFTFAFALTTKRRLETLKRGSSSNGPFVYRLGRKIFILERGVRFPYGLQLKLKKII